MKKYERPILIKQTVSLGEFFMSGCGGDVTMNDLQALDNSFEDDYTGNFTLNNYALTTDGTKALKTPSTGYINTVYQNYEDFTFDVDFKINSMIGLADGNFGVLYRQAENTNTFYFIEYNPQLQFFRVRRVVNSDWGNCTTIANIPMSLSLSTWHKMKVTSSNQNISVFVDEVQKASFANDLVAQGGLLINTYNNDVHVDNIEMQAIE